MFIFNFKISKFIVKLHCYILAEIKTCFVYLRFSWALNVFHILVLGFVVMLQELNNNSNNNETEEKV